MTKILLREITKCREEQKKAVRNVPIVYRANLKPLSTTKKVVPTAPLDLHKVKPIKRRATCATKAPKPKKSVPLPVKIVIWGNSTITKGRCVWIAQLVNFKTTKVKPIAKTAVKTGTVLR